MKYSPLKRAAALLTSIAFTIGITITESAAYGAGTELHKSVTTIADNANFVNRISTHSSGRQESFYFSYRPGGTVIPIVGFGDKLYGRKNITTAANQLSNQGVYVLGGVNADFFSLATGVPMGLTIADGKLLSDSAGRSAIAFNNDGSAFLTKPSFSFQLVNNGGGDPTTALGGAQSDHTGQTVNATYFNKLRQPYNIYLLSSDFGATNMVTTQGRDVLLKIESGDLTVSGSLSLRVEKVSEGSTATQIPQGYLLLTADARCSKYSDLTKFSVGDSVTLNIKNSDSRLNQAVAAFGGGDVLISGGAITNAASWDKDVSTIRCPRTAIGIKSDGTVVVYAVDGRQSGYSIGLTLQELAEEMLSMGCLNVINLDGGGSTSVLYRKPDGAQDVYSMVNKPSDGSARKCSSFLFLTTANEGNSTPTTLYFTPNDPIVLAGSTVQFSKLTARDSAYRPVVLPAETDRVYTVTGSGKMDGLAYTAGKSAGKDIVTVSGQGFTGSTTVTVVNSLDSLAVKRLDTGSTVSSLSLGYDSTIQLTGQGTSKGIATLSSSGAFTYQVSEQIGTISESGLLRATGKAGTQGTVTVSGGGKTVSIPVTISSIKPTLITDFESSAFSGDGRDTTRVAAEVMRGEMAGVLKYDFSDIEMKEKIYYLPEAVSFESAPSRFSVWTMGDGSGVTLGVVWQDSAGEKKIIPFAQKLDFAEYRLLTVKTGLTGAGKVVGLALSDDTSSARTGKIFVDQLTAPGDADASEEISPVIKMTFENGNLTASLSDDSGMNFNKKLVSVTADGKEVDFSLSNNTVKASISLSAGSMHRIAVKASDVFGNLSRSGINIPAVSAKSSFTDVTDAFWGTGYIEYLSNEGIITGVGENKFDPNGKMTRAAFCTMLTRYLGVDTDQYEYESLPFADVSSIPGWSVSSVKAMYCLGYVGGRQSGEQTFFAPNDSITRAEIFTLLGRLSQKGYEGACRVKFADSQTIPAWALGGVHTVVGMGVVKGYDDGTIRAGNIATRAEVASLLFNCF